jgi:hypothetical protein
MQTVYVCLAADCAVWWGLYDAWRSRQGALHYAAGEWVLAQGGYESQGTLHVVLDLQTYLLVRFTPSGHAPAHPQQVQLKAQWLHLESAYAHDWRALRRAVYAQGLPLVSTAANPGSLASAAQVARSARSVNPV